jgi:hypothetical protein
LGLIPSGHTTLKGSFAPFFCVDKRSVYSIILVYMKFDQIIEQLLLEMPWLDFEINGKQISIDLEMEKYLIRQDNQKIYDWKNLFTILVKILNGDLYTDKRGDSIQLTTPEEKEAFINALKSDMIFDSYRRKFPLNIEAPITLKNLFI